MITAILILLMTTSVLLLLGAFSKELDRTSRQIFVMGFLFTAFIIEQIVLYKL